MTTWPARNAGEDRRRWTRARLPPAWRRRRTTWRGSSRATRCRRNTAAASRPTSSAGTWTRATVARASAPSPAKNRPRPAARPEHRTTRPAQLAARRPFSGGRTLALEAWRRGGNRRLAGRAGQHLLRHILAAAQVGGQGANGIDRPPGDAPPAQQQREDGEPPALVDRMLIGADEIDVAGAPERHHHDGNAVLEQHELAAAGHLLLHLRRGQALGSDDLHLDCSLCERRRMCRSG